MQNDILSIISSPTDIGFFERLNLELEKIYCINFKYLEQYSSKEITSEPFRFTHTLLSEYNDSIIADRFYEELKLHCIISSLYTCELLTNNEALLLNCKDAEKYITGTNTSENVQNHIDNKRREIGMDNANRIKRFDKLIKTNFSSLIKFSIKKNDLGKSYRYLYKFLPNLFHSITMNLSNKTYFKLYNYRNDKTRFSQTFRRGINLLMSDYSTLFNFCIDNNKKNLVNNLLYYYKLENVFHADLLSDNLSNLFDKSVNVKQIELLTKLPNVFSRNHMISFIKNDNHISFISDFLIPLYQKVFFFIIYKYNKNQSLDFYEKINSVRENLILSLKAYHKKLYSFIEDKKSKFTYSMSERYDNIFPFTYKYDIANDISSVLNKLYVESSNDNIFANFSSKILATYFYNYAKLIPSLYTNLTDYTSSYKMLSYSAHALPKKYSEFLIFKKLLMFTQFDYTFPIQNEDSTKILFTYLSDLAYCSILIKYAINYNTDFIKNFIPLFNISFEFIYECDNFSNLFHKFFTVKEINLSDFSKDEMINALKIIECAPFYFVEEIFTFDEQNALLTYSYDNDISSTLSKPQSELTKLISSIEKALEDSLLSQS